MSDANDADEHEGTDPTRPPGAPSWPAPDWPETATTWISPGATAAQDATPTLMTPAETTPTAVPPTTVDPLVPPPVPLSAYPPPGPTAYPPPPPPAYPPGQYGQYPPPPPPAYPPGQYGQYGQYPPQYGGGALPGVSGWGAVPQAPKPGVVPLRPLGVGEILDGAISYIRRDPKTVLGISSVIALVLALVQFLALAATSRSFDVTTGSASATDAALSSLGSLTATLVQAVVGAVLGVMATGLLTVVMGQAVLGKRVTAAQAWDRTKHRFWPLLGLTLLISLVVGGVATVGIGLAVLLGLAVGNALNVGVGVLLGIVLGIAALVVATWVYVALLLAPVALMLESAGVGRSMRRSWELVKGAWWRTFGIYLLGSILAAIVSSVLTIPFTLVGTIATLGSLEDGGALPLGYTVSVSLATLVSSIVVLPFSAGIVALLYIDRRIRREGLDIELARAAGVGV